MNVVEQFQDHSQRDQKKMASMDNIQKFHLAVRKNEHSVIEQMLKRGMDPNCRLDPVPDYVGNLNTPLHAACSVHCAPQTIQMLLGGGADPNARNEHQETPLFRAQDPETMQLLLDAGADINAVNLNGQTPLHYSPFMVKEEQRSAMIHSLVNAGADIQAQDNEGNSVLCSALTSFDAMEALFDQGINPNLQDQKGNTVLHLAAEENNLECVQFLVKHGADLSLMNHQCQTPEEVVGRYESDVNRNESIKTEIRGLRIHQERQVLQEVETPMMKQSRPRMRM